MKLFQKDPDLTSNYTQCFFVTNFDGCEYVQENYCRLFWNPKEAYKFSLCLIRHDTDSQLHLWFVMG
jgi:hypothetical protein